MKSLLDGITTAFNGNGSLTGLFGTLDLSVAEDASDLPLCILTVLPPATPTFQTSTGIYAEQITCYFSCYSTDIDDVQNAEALLDAVFQSHQIAIGSDYNVLTLRNGGGNPYRDSDDAKVWRADYMFKFWVERF